MPGLMSIFFTFFNAGVSVIPVSHKIGSAALSAYTAKHPVRFSLRHGCNFLNPLLRLSRFSDYILCGNDIGSVNVL